MSKITAVQSEMEQDQLIQAEPRDGMRTTPQGNRIIADLLAGNYRNEATEILGPAVPDSLLQHHCLND